MVHLGLDSHQKKKAPSIRRGNNKIYAIFKKIGDDVTFQQEKKNFFLQVGYGRVWAHSKDIFMLTTFISNFTR